MHYAAKAHRTEQGRLSKYAHQHTIDIQKPRRTGSFAGRYEPFRFIHCDEHDISIVTSAS